MYEFKLPDLGEGIHEGEILKWYVEVGQEIFDLALKVAAGQRTCAERNRSAPFNYLKQGPSF